MGRSLTGQDAAAIEFFSAYQNEVPEHCATVGPFYLDTFEVTVGRFKAFLDHYDAWLAEGFPKAGQGANPNTQPDSIERTGWHQTDRYNLKMSSAELVEGLRCAPGTLMQTWPDEGLPEGDRLVMPISCLNWYDAFAFCVWDGGRLPTEAEWEFAAAGGAENRLYPWGNQPPDCHLANFTSCDYPDRIIPVGNTTTAGRFGHLDQSGNIVEWTFDGDEKFPYVNNVPAGCDNCVYSTGGTRRNVRGGGAGFEALTLRGAWRGVVEAERRWEAAGVRCARGVP
jgi:formylglycine-generating enzyme required for sulfatase activity